MNFGICVWNLTRILGVVILLFGPGSWELEIGGPGIQGNPQLRSL